MNLPVISHRFVDVGGVTVFYREAGPVDGTTVLLLHGFPSASHQYRRLMDALGDRHRLIAPDYPGFGHTEVPDGFSYSFDSLAAVIEGFVTTLGLEHVVMYMFDFGGPVGMRLASRRPDLVRGLIVQNANVYDEGLSEEARNTINAPAEELGGLFTLPVTRGQYETGARDLSLVSPDGWTLDQHYLDLPGRREAQLALALDYRANVALYPTWQSWLREHQPPTLVIWGRHDPFFPERGAHAYRRDIPDAEVHILDTGHFALEDRLPEVTPLIDRFLRRFDQTARAPASSGSTGRA